MSSQNRQDAALVQLRAWLTQNDFDANSRLPPERELCELLGVSRGDLRKALAALEADRLLWRHVGKGTFAGARPVADMINLTTIERQTNPAEVMRTRLLIEPEICREAALNATSIDVEEMRGCMRRTHLAHTWRQYEAADNELHRAIAEAAHNRLLLGIFDTLNAVRRAVVWGRLRTQSICPPATHHSFAEHERIVAAIADRDREGAHRAMLAHLQTVERNLLELVGAAA